MITHVDEILERWIHEWNNTLVDEIDEIEKQGMYTSLEGFEEFAKNLVKEYNMGVPPQVEAAISAIEQLVKDGDNTWNNVTAAWYTFIDTDYFQIDHKEFSHISNRLRIIYEGLIRLQGQNRYTGIKHDIDLGSEGKMRPKTDKELTDAILYIRKLWISSLALKKIPAQLEPVVTGGGGYGSTYDAIRDFVEDTNDVEWQIIKDKQIQVLEGKADMRIQITSKNFNTQIKGWAERGIGRDLKALFHGMRGNFIHNLTGHGRHKVDWGKLKGSRPLYGQITRQFIDMARGKKPKTYKNHHKSIGRSSAKAKKAPPTPFTDKLLKQRKIKRNIKGSFDKVSKKETEKQLSLKQIRQYINAGLKKRLMKNMGRPALRWQRGTFGGSAKLLDLYEKNNKIVGKYTYALHPYQTFENTGRWPAGYNPKPLIANSIKELALERHRIKIAYLWRG